MPGGLKQVVAIGSGHSHALAIKQDGTVVSWGGGYESSQIPAGLSDVVSVTCGLFHSIALRRDGTVVAWGSTQYGQTNFYTGQTGLVGIGAGDFYSMALGPNFAPQPVDRIVGCPPGQDAIIFSPPGVDPNGDPLTFRVFSMPTAGSLYQYTPAGRGELISTVSTPISDPQGRMIFAPNPDESGAPYSTFSVVANDGQYDSEPGVITVNVLQPPVLEPGAFGPNDTNTAFGMSFAGHSNATYSVWASTNLINWTRLGAASQPMPGQFQYTDVWRYYDSTFSRWRTNWNGTTRFYQIQSP